MASDRQTAPFKAKTHYWKEVWRFRELLYTLSWRDIKVRYKQTLIGVSWSVIRPLITTVIFTLVFTRIGKITNNSVAPYAITVFTAMLPWQFFSNTLSEVGFSITNNAGLIGKIYFPRIVIPLSSVFTNLVDFLISLLLLCLLMVWYHFMPGWQAIFFPLFLIMVAACVLGSGLCLAVLNVNYRDIKFIIPFVIQLGFFITPIAWSSSNIPDKWRLVYALNPLVGIISGLRWSLLGDKMYWPELWISMVISGLLLAVGVYCFRKMEKTFADTI